MGRATAHLFADEGARVAVVDIGRDGVDAVVAEITDAHGSEAAVGLVCDVGDLEQIRRLVDDVVGGAGRHRHPRQQRRRGPADVQRAGRRRLRRQLGPHVAVNLTAHAHLVRLAVPHLAAEGQGRVVNIASTEAIVTTAGMVAYTATKAGVVGLTKSFAVELGRQGSPSTASARDRSAPA